jgi:glycosyltransferase involved in cell wall biosynthesis
MIAGFKNKIPFLESLREADVVVSLTEWFKKILIVNGIPEDKIIVIPQATPGDHETEIISKGKQEGFVFIGRINKEKGIEILLSAAEKLAKRNPEIYIDIYGPIPLANRPADRFMEKIKRYNNIKYKGILSPDAVLSTMGRYKAVLLPSLFTEMAPLIISEANKVKVPVIVSDVPGSSEMVKSYNSGLIFKYNSAEDLVEKILHVNKGGLEFKFEQPSKNDFNGVAMKYMKLFKTHEKTASKEAGHLI